MSITKRKIGVVGYGHLGKFLIENILSSDDLELAFVWNRTQTELRMKIAEKYILTELDAFHEKDVDLIVEVAHPTITENYGERFLQHADYMIGSPTAMAKPEVEFKLRAAAQNHGLYVPAGAFWGGEDIKKMADRRILHSLKVSMTKHPDSFRLLGSLQTKLEEVKDEKSILYEGPVRDLCPLAPNNVNTMAAAAVAAHTLGFDGVQGCLIADPKLTDYHIVEVDAYGPPDASGSVFRVHTVRQNPANLGAVTGSATYNSFLSSVLSAKGKGAGVHLC